MATKAVAEVQGARKLRKTLRAAGDDLTDLKIVHGQAAATAAGAIRRIAPDVTGRLKNTIRASGTKTAGIVRVGNNSRVKYGPPIHWGWAARRIAPNPFASTGAQRSESAWLPLYERYIDAALTKIEGI